MEAGLSIEEVAGQREEAGLSLAGHSVEAVEEIADQRMEAGLSIEENLMAG